MLNVEKYDLPANVISEINAQVLTMLATGTAYQFDENTYEDFASSIHNLVDLSIQLGKEGVAVRSELLRDELAKRGIRAPTDDFIYFGGRCISTPTMFIPKSSRKEVAEKMADDIISKMFTEEESGNDTVVDALISSAAIDDILLSMRSEALARKVNEKFPEYEVQDIIGNFVFLPDGTLLSLHYMNEHDPDWPCEDEDVDETEA